MSALVRRKAFSAGRSETPPFSSTKSTLADAISPRGFPVRKRISVTSAAICAGTRESTRRTRSPRVAAAER